jgi:hypothetical protein
MEKLITWGPTHTNPNIFYPTTKIKILLPLSDFQKGMSHPYRTITLGKDRFLETGHFWLRAIPWRKADLRPPHKNYLHRVGLVVKISSRCVYSIKSCSTLSRGHRKRQTLPWSHPYTVPFPFLDTFHFNKFMKDNCLFAIIHGWSSL